MKLIIFAALVAVAVGACPNKCGGHGTCGIYDQCTCQVNWQGNDCSERTCAYGLSWVAGTGSGPNGGKHEYAECSGKGLCDRGSGECQCFDGYDGKGCRRQVCPNDCSGHGRCATNAAVTNDGLVDDFTGSAWDSAKTRSCVCDRGFEGLDCSDHTCPKGDDPLTECETRNEKNDVQLLLCESTTDQGEAVMQATANYATLTFTDMMGGNYTTKPIQLNDQGSGSCTIDQPQAGLAAGECFYGSAGRIKSALEALPNFAIPSVTVSEFHPQGLQKIVTTKTNACVVRQGMRVVSSNAATPLTGVVVNADSAVSAGGFITVQADYAGTTALATSATDDTFSCTNCKKITITTASATLGALIAGTTCRHHGGVEAVVVSGGASSSAAQTIVLRALEADTGAQGAETSGKTTKWQAGDTNMDFQCGTGIVYGKDVALSAVVVAADDFAAIQGGLATRVTESFGWKITFSDAANSGKQVLLDPNTGIHTASNDVVFDHSAVQPRFTVTAADASKVRCKTFHVGDAVGSAVAVGWSSSFTSSFSDSAAATGSNRYNPVHLISSGYHADNIYKEAATCSNRGSCDSSSGTCECYDGHSGDACETQTTFF